MKNLLSTVVILILGVVIGIGLMKIQSTNVIQEVKISKEDEEKVKSIFSSGCEVGIMKYCEVSKQENCRRYCLLFLEANPDVLKMITSGIRD